jgi:uncharacterized protein (TIGR00661 family)
MRILYAVQATGNGHISRAHQLFPVLSKFGKVDIILSGSNSTLDINLPVKYRSKGFSLFYTPCGGLDYWRSWKQADYAQIQRDILDLPVQLYDIVINDFDYVTAQSCRLKKQPSIQFGHQASFMSPKTPRPVNKSFIGEFILKNYARATYYAGLHFERYDQFIFPPVIKQEIINSHPKDQGHITVYLPAYLTHCLENIFKEASHFEFHWFLPEIRQHKIEGNIHYYPVNQEMFNDSLIHCHGLLTGGGFETPSEALFLGKKLMTIPIKGQYEQQCNAQALEQMGVNKLDVLNEITKQEFFRWLDEITNSIKKIEHNNLEETFDFILNKF